MPFYFYLIKTINNKEIARFFFCLRILFSKLFYGFMLLLAVSYKFFFVFIRICLTVSVLSNNCVLYSRVCHILSSVSRVFLVLFGLEIFFFMHVRFHFSSFPLLCVSKLPVYRDLMMMTMMMSMFLHVHRTIRRSTLSLVNWLPI